MATLHGDNANNTLIGTDRADHIRGYDGDDYIVGHAGNDVVHGGRGNDYITDADDEYGDNGGGYNRFYGSDGDDQIFGGWTRSELHGGNGNDTLDGTGRLYGDGGNDTLRFSGADYHLNTVHGGAGNDLFQGGYGQLYGDAGDDTFYANGHIRGGSGNDYFDPQGDLQREADSILPPSYLTGGPGADTFDIANVANSIDIGHITVNDFHPDQGDRVDLLSYRFEDEVGKGYAQQRLDHFWTFDQNWSTGTQVFDGVIRIGDFGTSAAPDGSLQLHPLDGVGDLTLKGVDHVALQDWLVA